MSMSTLSLRFPSAELGAKYARAIRTFCQIPQPFDLWRGEHVFGAAPAPVALGPAWHVHPSLGAEVEHILQWSDRERGRRGPRQLHHAGAASLLRPSGRFR